MIQVEDEKMIFLDANAFYSYYGRSKLGMTSEPVDEKRLKKYLDQQSEKSLPTSVYIEIMTHFRNNPKVLQSLLEFRYAKGLPLFNNIPDYVVSEDEITSVAYMDQVALKNYADRLLKSKIQIESKFTLLFFEITKDLYAHYKLEMTDGLSKKNKDAILGYIGRVAYKEYQNLLEERIKEELQSGYDENKEKKVLKDFYIQELNEACVLTNIIIQGCVACKQDKEDIISIVQQTYQKSMLDPTIRWTDRLQSSSGDWSGNVFDFFFRVNSKIAKDIKKPFKLEGITRVDDTPVHKAVREALVNCLVNTDYFLPCGVVIKKEDDKLVIENPGSIRTGKKQMLRGGISDPRNKTLMKMFNMIGIGERAGSGIPDIYQVWENEGWPMPVVEESYNPDRTRLSLEFAKKQTIKTSEEEKEPKRSQKGAEKEPIKGAERKKEILKLIKVNSTITQVEIMKELDLTRKQVQKDMKELQEMHIIAREGTNRRGRWIIVKENK